jgi:hypothetical protein
MAHLFSAFQAVRLKHITKRNPKRTTCLLKSDRVNEYNVVLKHKAQRKRKNKKSFDKM